MSARPLQETQAFFAARAANWDVKFPDDGPAFAHAAAALAPAPGAAVLDVGCGTGRALGPLRRLVGPSGRVVALDATWEMLVAARTAGRTADGALVFGDAAALPFARGCFDAVFAGAIVHHLPAPTHGLDELARVSRPGARLAIFHPIGRAALAARHGATLRADDLLAAGTIEPLLKSCGWTLQAGCGSMLGCRSRRLAMHLAPKARSEPNARLRRLPRGRRVG